jgi:hypothetical protein
MSMRLFNFVAAVAAAAAFVSAVSLPASAECKRFGFTVNDYGKDGPTKDAKGLLDKLIASKMTERGVKDFHTGKKSVSCELFLNFIVFDEHTCTAEATVCWGGTPLPKSEQTAAVESDATAKTAKTSSGEPAEKVTKNKKKELAKKSEAKVSEKKTVAVRIPDPKSTMQHKSEAKAETAQPSESAQPATAAAQPDTSATEASQSASENASSSDTAAAGQKADTSPSTETAAADKHEASTKKPVETGSLGETAKKHTKHHAEKVDSGTSEAAPEKPAAGNGYPTPMPPKEAPSP